MEILSHHRRSLGNCRRNKSVKSVALASVFLLSVLSAVSQVISSTHIAGPSTEASSKQKPVDASTAKRIGEAGLAEGFGAKHVASYKPFHAKRGDGVWLVYGTLHCRDVNGNAVTGTSNCVGSIPIAIVQISDGRVLLTMHTQ